MTGIWHGVAWNFVVWGIGYFIAISFERITKLPERIKSRVVKFAYRILVILFVNLQWVIFNSDSLYSGLRFIKRMFLCNPNEVADVRAAFLFKDYFLFIITAIILCFPIVPWLEEKTKKNKILRASYNICMTIIILFSFYWAIFFIVAGQNNPFAYANF